DGLVVGGHGGVAPFLQVVGDQPPVVGVHVGLAGIGPVGRLGVSPFDQAHVGALCGEAAQVLLGPVEHGLDDHAHVVEVLAQAPVDLQGAVDGVRVLHIDADKVAQGRGPLHHPADVLVGQVGGQFQAQLRELHGNIGVEPVGGDAVENVQVNGGGGPGLGLLRHALAQVVQGDLEAVAV